MTTASMFPLLGEPFAVDLVNTRVKRNGVLVDLFDRPAALAAWLRTQRRRVQWSGAVGAADLQAVVRLRDAIDALFGAFLDKSRPAAEAVERINGVLSQPPPAALLTWPAAGPSRTTAAAGLQRAVLLYALAQDAVTVLTGPQAAQLRNCAHPDCVLRFVARNPRRRWCSAALCGNRARVSRHYTRHRAAH